MGEKIYRGLLIRARNLSAPHKSRAAGGRQKSFDSREIRERINRLKNNSRLVNHPSSRLLLAKLKKEGEITVAKETLMTAEHELLVLVSSVFLLYTWPDATTQTLASNTTPSSIQCIQWTVR